jgi:hypothetical protein
MNLYIEIENGQTKNHPALEDNLIQAFGAIPENWEPFVRVEQPTISMHQVLESEVATYTKVDGVWTDVWSIREMTAEEKETVRQAAITAAQTAWAAREQGENWSAWVFNEEAIKYEPPIPRPTPDQTKLNQRIFTYWCGAEGGWKDTPAMPVDDNQYKFDFLAWNWVPIVN